MVGSFIITLSCVTLIPGPVACSVVTVLGLHSLEPGPWLRYQALLQREVGMSFWQGVALYVGGCVISVATSIATMELLIHFKV